MAEGVRGRAKTLPSPRDCQVTLIRAYDYPEYDRQCRRRCGLDRLVLRLNPAWHPRSPRLAAPLPGDAGAPSRIRSIAAQAGRDLNFLAELEPHFRYAPKPLASTCYCISTLGAAPHQPATSGHTAPVAKVTIPIARRSYRGGSVEAGRRGTSASGLLRTIADETLYAQSARRDTVARSDAISRLSGLRSTAIATVTAQRP